MYNSTDEFMDCYTKGNLNKFNTMLYEDYIDLNFGDKDLFDYFNVDIQYKDGCECNKKNSDKICKCENDTYYYDDKFMWDKIPMFPKNMRFQKYYDLIFPKRIFNNKIFYYLPYGCKRIYTTYIDKTIINTFDVKRNIVYTFINDKLVLVEDSMDGWFGNMFYNYHMTQSIHFTKYMEKLEEYQKNNELKKDDFYYNLTIIKF